MRGDAAAAFHSKDDAEEAIWRTITWAERVAEQGGHKRFDWATESNFRIVRLQEVTT